MKTKQEAITANLNSQVAALTALSDHVEEKIITAEELLAARTGTIVFVGVGKSGHICAKLAATFTSLGHRAHYIHPVEALHGDMGGISDGDAIILVSHSGTSEEVVKMGRYLKTQFQVSIIAITSNAASPLGQLADHVIHYEVADEGCPIGVAPMVSTTVTLVIGHLLASALTIDTSFSKQQFAKNHPGGSLGLQFKLIAESMSEKDDVPQVVASASVTHVTEEIDRLNYGIVAVVNAGRLVGAVTDGDLRRAIRNGIDLNAATAEEVMTPEPKIITASATLLEALTVMEKYKITSLFVVGDAGQLAGIIRMHDIIEGNIVKV